MRITNQWKYAQTMYDYQRGMRETNKHYSQLSNGLKIDNSYENSSIYNDAKRLEYEVSTLEQVELATSKSQNFSKNSDSALQEISKQLELFKVKLVQAASDVHSTTSLGALANDLEGIRDHLVNLANTSINGQFLFSGSAVDTKPISNDGTYNGNAEQMTTVGGSKIEIPYNLNGFDLFLGRDNDYSKILNTNVKLQDLSSPDFKDNVKYLNEESKIRNLIGLNYAKDSIESAKNDGLKNYNGSIQHSYDFLDNTEVKFPDTFFYLQGTKPDGTGFTSKFQISHDSSMRALLDKIGTEFGNTATSKVVEVTMNNDGQIEVKDLIKGNQVINFALVGATEQVQSKSDLEAAAARATGGTSPASVSSLADLQTAANNGSVYITDFTKNLYKDNEGNVVDSFDFDKVKFERKDNKLHTNITQINRTTGEYATDSTRLSEAASVGELYPGSETKYNIDNQTIKLEIKSRTNVKYTIDIKLGTQNPSKPVTFSISGINPDGSNKFGTRTLAVYNADAFGQYWTQTDDFTYRQLMDIVGMAASDNIPNPPYSEVNPMPENHRFENYQSYATAINKSRGMIEVNLDSKGKIQLVDKSQSVTNIEVSIYDSKESGKFYGDSTGKTPATSQGKGAAFSFMQNNAVMVDEPGIDLFKDLTSMIDAVRHGYYRQDANNADPRNTGMQGAIKRIDHLMDHINKEKVKIGSYTNLLQSTNERASIMRVNVSSVKSEVIDVDYGEAYLSLTQKMMSYQAMLQATSKINQLSLLNYM
ncbi:hypothetical protein LMG7974_00514 [Campylobacter majalis]|uniref:Flagellin n=1 Tax=Campylobacter majalis TaxID=2790656 RepID=A0ABN7K526_9BACT|nr:flagellin [Campylobacter majalis]CAD7287634.1 hypothetical protein LMG7974_00514 [Campylobacter majalis]